MGTLHTVQPFRNRTDNTVAVLGQGLVLCWVYALLLRVIGVGDVLPPALLSLYLVVATIAVFVYAFYAVFVELRKKDSSANDTTTADEENAEIPPHELSAAHKHDPRRGSSPPGDPAELELTVLTGDEDENTKRTTSPWQLLGLCSADAELLDEESPENTKRGDDVAELLAQLAAQSKLIDTNAERMRAKDAAIREKDAEIGRLRAAASAAGAASHTS